MTRRQLKVRVAARPTSEATNDPDALAQAVTAWLLGRTNQQPTIYVPRRTA